jgi:hypothetical protein
VAEMIPETVKQAWIAEHLLWTCRKIPNLRLMPSHCEARKAMYRHSCHADTYMHRECSDCPGPRPINGDSAESPVLTTRVRHRPPIVRFHPTVKTRPEPEADASIDASPASIKQRKPHKPHKVKPHLCKCGETDPDKFFTGEKSTCARCRCAAHRKRYSAKARKTKVICPSCHRARKVSMRHAAEIKDGLTLCPMCAKRRVDAIKKESGA